MLKVNSEKKIITRSAKLTKEEEEDLKFYVSCGYTIKRKKDGVTYDDMKKALKDDKANLAELEKKIANKDNYLGTLKWFKEVTK